MAKERYRYHIGSERFSSIAEAKAYILAHKDQYKAQDGGYKMVSIYCGTVRKGDYKYYPEMRKVVRVI